MNAEVIARRELVKITKNLVGFLHGHSIRRIVMVDRSARPAHIGLFRVWHKHHPGESAPQIYFVNPAGFSERYRSGTEIVNDLRESYPRLNANLDGGLMIFDACIHGGRTIEPVVRGFERAGFKKLYIGVAQPPLGEYSRPVQFQALDYPPISRCTPFGYDAICTKPPYSVVPEKSKDSYDLRYSRELRMLISEMLDKEDYRRGE